MKLTDWRKKYNVPTNKYLAQKTLEYSSAKDWYKNSFYSIQELLFKIDNKHIYSTKLFINILAATSPRNSVKQNLKYSIDIYLAIINNQPVDSISCGLATKQIHKNINRVLNGEPLSGKKVRPFAAALLGDPNAVVVDTWMIKCFNINRQAPTPNDLKHITTIINKISTQTGLEPAEVQACLWSYAKTELNDTVFKEANDYSFYIKELI